MKAVKTIILILVSSIVFGQGIKESDIVFSSEQEVKEGIEYLNKFRATPSYACIETGLFLSPNTQKEPLLLDKELSKLAKLRVIEMIENYELSHNTKYDISNYSEVASFSGERDIKDNIHQFIESEGHRDILMYEEGNTKIGYAAGWYKTEGDPMPIFWVCAILSE